MMVGCCIRHAGGLRVLQKTILTSKYKFMKSKYMYNELYNSNMVIRTDTIIVVNFYKFILQK